MKQTLKTIALIAAMSGLTTATQAQIVVWSQNFDSLSPGAYGSTTDYANDPTNPANPALNIVSPGFGGSGNAEALTFTAVTGTTINLQSKTAEYAAAGNTSANLSDYTLEFDLAIEGADVAVGYGGIEVNVFGPGSGIFNGDASRLDWLASPPAAGSGYQHYSLNLGTFVADTTALVPTDGAFSFGIGLVGYGNSINANPETFLVDNLQITMVPEPSTLALLAGGIGLLAAGWRRQRPAT